MSRLLLETVIVAEKTLPLGKQLSYQFTAVRAAESSGRSLADFYSRQFLKKGMDMSTSPRAVLRLRNACERAKCALSFVSHTRVVVDSVLDEIDLDATLTRGEFELICCDLFVAALEPVRTVLADSRLAQSDICSIVVGGGSSRIPRIQSLLSALFGGKVCFPTYNRSAKAH